MRKRLILLLLSFLIIALTCKNEKAVDFEVGDDVRELKEFRALELKKSKDVSKTTINYFDIESFDNSNFKLKEDDSPFEITDYGPIGELPVEMKHPTIYVMFSQPVVPISKLGAVLEKSPIMSIEPGIKGIYRWYGTKLLSFEPTDKYMPQREYTVKINKSVKSLGGKKFEGKNSFSFHTEYLDIASFYVGDRVTSYYFDDMPLDESKKIIVSFTYPVNINVIKKYIKITSRGKNYKFKIKRPKNEEGFDENYVNRTIVLNVTEKFKENSDVQIILTKGARSEADYLGRKDDAKRTFHTLKPFKYRRYDTYSYSFPRSGKSNKKPCYLKFSHPVDEKSVKNNIEISVPVSNISDHVEVWGNNIKIANLPVDHEDTYTVTLKKGIKDVYGRSLNKDKKINIKVPAANRYYYFPNWGTRMLESQFAPKIIYEYQNVFDGVWKIDSINDPYSSFGQDELGPYDFSKAVKNEKNYEILDLSPYLNSDKKGFVGMSWNFGDKNARGERYKWSKHDLQLQVTDIGVTTRYGYNKIIVWIHSLTDGSPVSDADVYLKRGNSEIKKSGKTDNKGLAVFTVDEGEYIKNFYYDYKDLMRIRVEKGSDKVEFKPNSSHNPYHFGLWSTSNPKNIQEEKAEVFIFTDRGLYKPGETLTYRGIDRTLKLGQYFIYEGNYKLIVKENKYKAKPFHQASGSTTESGGFYGSFKIPDDIDPGYYRIEYTRNGQTSYASFQIAHFRRLNFAVKIKKPDITYFTGDTINMKIQANYLAGGSVGGGGYDYYWARSSTYFHPKDERWKSYRFGPDKYDYYTHLSSKNGKLSPNGEVAAKQKTEQGIKGVTYNYELEARIEDIDRQMVAGYRSVIVHPANFYIGAKLESKEVGWWSPFVSQGKKVNVDYVVVDPEGEKYNKFDKNSKLNVRLYRVDWKVTKQQGVYGRINMRWERVEELEYENEVDLKDMGKINITPKKCGSYFLELESADSKKRSAVTRLNFYSTGSSWVRWRQEGDVDITMVADKSIYKPGENVKLLIQSPMPEGEYLLTIEREGIFEEKIIKLEGSANVIDIPVKDDYLPIFYVALSSFSKREKDPPKTYLEPDLGKPKGYFGIIPIKVSTESKELKIEIIPSDKIASPGEETEVTIKAMKDGKPLANTEITFMACDRGVLDLINYHVPNPIDFFYSTHKFPLGVLGADSRSLLIDPVTYEVTDLHGGDSEDQKMKKRKDFRPTAVFKPFLVTDSNGIAKVKFKLPDTLTTYRCTAVAVQKDLFGIQEEEIMVQNPINIRTALPRRLRVRDTSIAGVIATNLDSKDHKVTVSLKSDLLNIDGKQKQSVTVPANGTIEIPFKLLAVKPGEATLEFTIISDVLKEQLEDKLTIEKPIIKEAFTTIGKTKDEEENPKIGFAEEGVIIPSNIQEGYGGFTVTVDSTRLASLSESINYLFTYPYGCLEQRTSRLLPLVIFGDKVKAFGLDTQIDDIEKTIKDNLIYIAKFQNYDGGFCFWLEYGGKSSNYSSLKLAHILYYAKKNGYSIPKNIKMDKLLKFISRIPDDKYASQYCKLYAIYIQALYEKNIIVQADKFAQLGDKLGMSGYGFLALAYYENNKKGKAKDILTRMKNFMKVGTRTIDLVETYESRYYFDSDVTSIALYLMLYHKLDPNSDFIAKITNTLMKRQKYGYWVNTSDTAWALQALSQVFEDEAGTKTNFKAVVQVNKKDLIKVPFRGVSKESYTKFFSFDDSPVDKLKKNTLYPLTFEKKGTGVLYYTTTITYALPAEVVFPRDEGLSVFTEIYDLEGKKIKGKKLELGETYKMRAIVSTSKRRNYVVLRVPIPSGAEILDSSFVTTASFKEKGGTDSHRITRETIYGDEYDFYNQGYYYMDSQGIYYYTVGPIQKIMDNEVRYFFDDFYTGKQEVEFLFRVTTPGIYPTPPAYAECMYEEEVFGRSSGKLFILE